MCLICFGDCRNIPGGSVPSSRCRGKPEELGRTLVCKPRVHHSGYGTIQPPQSASYLTNTNTLRLGEIVVTSSLDLSTFDRQRLPLELSSKCVTCAKLTPPDRDLVISCDPIPLLPRYLCVRVWFASSNSLNLVGPKPTVRVRLGASIWDRVGARVPSF